MVNKSNPFNIMEEIMKEFYFHPRDENALKKQAVNNFVRTLIFEVEINKVNNSYIRKVCTEWTQTVKNNIETDHRVRNLPENKKYQIYSWVVKIESDFSLPSFHKR